MLLRGDFQPGERLSELPLVARLGVSRTPIRLALDRLAHEGLLEASPTGGFVVRAFTIEDVWDAIETRGVLEGAAARFAAERLEHDSELAQLREYRDEMDAMIGINGDKFAEPDIDSFARYLDLNEAFHSEIVKLAKSSMLRRALDRVNCSAVRIAQRTGVRASQAPPSAADVRHFPRASPLHRGGHRAKARHARGSFGARTFPDDQAQRGICALRYEHPEWRAGRVADSDPTAV